MATIRQGLKTVSGNSPAITQLQLNKSQDITSRSPTKLLLKKAFVPSPMIREENKENCSQTYVVQSTSEVQTEVSAMEPATEITEFDLESEVETVNYWKNLHEESLREMEQEENRTMELLSSLDDSINELKETEEKLDILKEVLAETNLTDVNTSESL